MRMSVREYQQLAAKSSRPVPPIPGMGKTKRPPKYRNIRVYVYEDGMVLNEKVAGHGAIVMKFDSTKEYRRWEELKLLARGGVITDLKRQELLILQPSFTDKDGKKHRAIGYRADFMYTQDGERIVEDVKGFDRHHSKYITTQAFELKWKLLQNKYPEYTFRLF